MIEVSHCVICEGALVPLKRALVAPFLAERIWKRAPFCVSLVRCVACGFLFYNPRLDDKDLRHLYSEYRSESYQRMRFSSEPWYTKRFNHDLASAKSYENRRARISPILKRHLGTRRIARILDHGGDRGDLVVNLIDGADAFVYDISGMPPATGVTATDDPVGCHADLIVNSNVLEHVGFPRPLVAGIVNATTDGGLAFLEVPCEHPFGLPRIARRIAQIGLMAITHPRLTPSIIRPASLYMMHEHINYFSEQTLNLLFERSGGKIVASGRYASSGRAGDADMAWCLGTKA
jgi:hypothetical protein